MSGLGLLAMVVLMTAGYFGGVVRLITPGDAAKTAQDMSQSGAIYLAGVACVFLVILLDVPVAGAWYALFKKRQPAAVSGRGVDTGHVRRTLRRGHQPAGLRLHPAR